MHHVAPVGYIYDFTSKEGGGRYTVIGNVNCSRCNTIVEEREWSEPSKKHKKAGHYYQVYKWCHVCGLFEPDEGSRVVIGNKCIGSN